MRRWLLNVLSALSLLLCAATVVLWFLSYFTPETFLWERCDSLSSHRLGEDGELSAHVPEGPTTDLTFEVTLYRGRVRLRRERLLGTFRQIALGADNRPAKISAPGWHFAGTLLGTNRKVIVFGEGGAWGADWRAFGPDAGREQLPGFEWQRGPELPFGPRGDWPATEMDTVVVVSFWILFAATLIFPACWMVHRVMTSRRRRLRPHGPGGAKFGATPDHGDGQGLGRCLIFASALSLLLCIATVRLWVGSRREQSELLCYAERMRAQQVLGASFLVDFTRGEMRILVVLNNRPIGGLQELGPNTVEWNSWSPADAGSPEWQWGRTGFGWHSDYDARDPITQIESSAWTILAPLWFVVLVLAILPSYMLARVMRLRRERLRLARNFCPSCGYDLRASSLRCPECGAACKAASPAGASPAAGD